MTYRDEKPLFIDPIAISEGDGVDDVPAPLWFRLLALALLSAAAYYLFTFLDGPRDSWRHDLERGRSAYENSSVVEPSASESPAAEASPSPDASASPSS